MKRPIMQVRQKRKELLLILATVVFVALAVNLAGSYLFILFTDDATPLPVLTAICLLVGLILLRHVAFGSTEHIIRCHGAVAYNINGDKLEPIEIIGYRFNDDFCQYLGAFVHENAAYLRLLSVGNGDVVPMTRFEPDNLNHHTIINSVVEFTVLHQIHLELNSYFIEQEIDRSRIVELRRRDLSVDVLRNRVIDQMTKDMKERPAFSQDSKEDRRGGEVVFQFEGGAIYERFNLELPPNSTIGRNHQGFVVITNPLFDLTIMPKYEGGTTWLPHIYTPKMDRFRSLRAVSVKIHIRVKSKALLTRESMELYEWLDSLIERVQDYISTDRLTQRLDADLVRLLTSKSADPSGR